MGGEKEGLRERERERKESEREVRTGPLGPLVPDSPSRADGFQEASSCNGQGYFAYKKPTLLTCGNG